MIGVILFLIGMLWFIGIAFRQGTMWGFGALFFIICWLVNRFTSGIPPPGGLFIAVGHVVFMLVFIGMHFQKAWKPIALQALGFLLMYNQI